MRLSVLFGRSRTGFREEGECFLREERWRERMAFTEALGRHQKRQACGFISKAVSSFPEGPASGIQRDVLLWKRHILT